MVEKLDIAKDWLPRYTGSEINELGDYILLTNFKHYVSAFSERFNSEIKARVVLCKVRTTQMALAS